MSTGQNCCTAALASCLQNQRQAHRLSDILLYSQTSLERRASTVIYLSPSEEILLEDREL